jgi:hypothetical protein
MPIHNPSSTPPPFPALLFESDWEVSFSSCCTKRSQRHRNSFQYIHVEELEGETENHNLLLTKFFSEVI